jgi:hypothetical protein
MTTYQDPRALPTSAANASIIHYLKDFRFGPQFLIHQELVSSAVIWIQQERANLLGQSELPKFAQSTVGHS